jgi:Ca2+-binding RTX toxin-like protein
MTTTTFSSSVITEDDDPMFTYAASGDNLIVNAGVTLSNQGLFLIYGSEDPLNAPTNLHATINGTLSAPVGFAFHTSAASAHLTVGSAGRVYAHYWAFIGSEDSSVANHGVIHADQGSGVSARAGSMVENWGTIFGFMHGVEFMTDLSASVTTLVNHGTIESGAYRFGADAVASYHGNNLITNEGTIRAVAGESAGIMLWGGSGTINNSGTIESNLYYGVTDTVSSSVFTITNEGTISGARGSLALGRSADTVTNDGHLDGRVTLGSGADVYHGENGRVTGEVWGQAGNDLLVGGDFADILGGGSGRDTLMGGGGADTLTGSTRADVLSGGAGDDLFRFATAGESVGDTVVASGGALAFAGAGAAGGDRIDVSAIDANLSLAGNQAFVFGSSHDLGRLWAVDVGDVTHIRGNVTGNAAREFDLAIDDGAGVHASDYAGVDFIL